jgi:hypothetical protein
MDTYVLVSIGACLETCPQSIIVRDVQILAARACSPAAHGLAHLHKRCAMCKEYESSISKKNMIALLFINVSPSMKLLQSVVAVVGSAGYRPTVRYGRGLGCSARAAVRYLRHYGATSPICPYSMI